MGKLKQWCKAAAIRAIRTFAEAMLAYIGTNAIVLGDVHWLGALSAGCMGAVIAVLIALAGLPEVQETVVPTISEWREDIDDPEG